MRAKSSNWWMLVPSRGLFITNDLLPSDIDDDKKSTFQDFQVPGLDYAPSGHVRNEGTDISMSIPFFDQSTAAGNALQLQQVEVLRHIAIDISSINESQFASNPVVWYSGWGTHRPPLPFQVRRAKIKHNRDFTNNTGQATWSEVDFELKAIEDHKAWIAYLLLANAAAYGGTAQQVAGNGGFR